MVTGKVCTVVLDDDEYEKLGRYVVAGRDCTATLDGGTKIGVYVKVGIALDVMTGMLRLR